MKYNAKSLRKTEFSTLPQCDDFVNKLLKKYGAPIGSGRNRTVFASKNYVFKVPRCPEGCSDNEWETCVSGEGLPKTRLLIVNGIEIAVMQRVKELTALECSMLKEEDSWIYSIDGQQVGITKRGKLVAFDYAGKI